MHLKIRKIIAEDNASAAAMIRSVFEDFNAPKEGTVYTDPSTDYLYQHFKNKEKSVFWVLTNGEEVLGTCGLYPTKGLPEGTVELVKFYMSSKTRGMGYGKKLLDKTIASAKELGYNQIYLESIELFDKAKAMYANRGFESIPNTLGDSGHFSCEVKMIKKL